MFEFHSQALRLTADWHTNETDFLLQLKAVKIFFNTDSYQNALRKEPKYALSSLLCTSFVVFLSDPAIIYSD
jgi:hypothetical protein